MDVELTAIPEMGGPGTVPGAGRRLVRALEADERFRRDTALGGMFHPGRISFRETSPVDSLHVVIRGEQVSAHVDEISPLVLRADGSHTYAWGRVLAHNVLVVVGDVSARLRGRRGRQRCELHCHAEWVDEEPVAS